MKKKKIYQLSKDDIVYICQGDNTAFKTLFGFTFNRDGCFVSNGLHKVGELQRAWIKYYTSECLPEFPRSYTHSNNFADMRYALFTMLGSEIVDSGSFKGSVSFFSPVPLSFLDYYFNSRIGRDKVNSIFSKFGYSPSLGFNSHSLRHYSNTLADLSDISPSIITAWSGRVNIKQTDTYIHTDEGFKSEKIKVVMQDEASNRQHIRIRSIEELAASTNLFATETSTGICTQNLNLTPCDYINDFVSQCFLCNEACYIAGDEKAIELLERDCQYQRRRLESVRVDKRLKNSDAMQVWFRVHLFNTSILSSLVELMKEKPLGNTIIYARNSSEFRITDLSSGDRHIVKSRLPDVEKELDRIINSSNNPDQSTNKNEDLSCLLEKFGLSPGDL
ncbi:putative integrase [Vibrio ishigakensis]|uniref:Putative integrase n=1 Tax=Vibrio ishigakensis TaxID=1481914 RepID=A0A0B8PGF3_9VIBR|nr:putative integrase [Vibrio ishigakensis]